MAKGFNSWLERRMMSAPQSGPAAEPKAIWSSRTWDYFLTDIIPQVGMSIELKFSMDNGTDNGVTMIGVRQTNSSDNGSYMFDIADNTNPNWKANGKKFPFKSTIIPRLAAGTHLVKGDDNGVTVDGVRYNFADYQYQTYNATYPTTQGIGIGRCTNSSGGAISSNSPRGAFIYLKVWDANQNLIHHLIPYPIEGYESYAKLHDLVTEDDYLPAYMTVAGQATPGIILYSAS